LLRTVNWAQHVEIATTCKLLEERFWKKAKRFAMTIRVCDNLLKEWKDVAIALQDLHVRSFAPLQLSLQL